MRYGVSKDLQLSCPKHKTRSNTIVQYMWRKQSTTIIKIVLYPLIRNELRAPTIEESVPLKGMQLLADNPLPQMPRGMMAHQAEDAAQ